MPNERIAEQILQHWLTLLRTIEPPDAWYKFDVVQRWTLGTLSTDGKFLVTIMHGAESQAPSTSQSKDRYLEIHNLIEAKHRKSEDGLSTETVLNRLESDIYRKVMVDHQLGGLAHNTEWLLTTESTAEQDGAEAERDVVFRVHYRHKHNDDTQK